MSSLFARAALAVVASLALVGVAVAAVGAHFDLRMDERREVRVDDRPIPTSSTARARGEYLARTWMGCVACHGEGLAGQVVFELEPLGRVVAPNLTSGPGGVGPRYPRFADWARAIRHAVGADGRPLAFMPASQLPALSDDDLAALVAYAASQPPRASTLPSLELGVVAKVLDELDLLPIDHARRVAGRPPPAAPPLGPTAAHGANLARACAACHRPSFTGGPIPGVPPEYPAPSNLTRHASGLAAWSEADLRVALRTGHRPDGSPIRPPMPIAATRGLTDDDLRALWLALSALPPKPTGAR